MDLLDIQAKALCWDMLESVSHKLTKMDDEKYGISRIVIQKIVKTIKTEVQKIIKEQ